MQSFAERFIKARDDGTHVGEAWLFTGLFSGFSGGKFPHPWPRNTGMWRELLGFSCIWSAPSSVLRKQIQRNKTEMNGKHTLPRLLRGWILKAVLSQFSQHLVKSCLNMPLLSLLSFAVSGQTCGLHLRRNTKYRAGHLYSTQNVATGEKERGFLNKRS